MLSVILILLFAAFLAFAPLYLPEKQPEQHSAKYNAQMKQLWQIAKTSMREHKSSRAERALLTILKFDEKNAAAYNRLGILYAKSHKYDEAIECFEIAQSLDPNPSCLHNVGLIYLETGAHEKAVMAFRQAIEMEGDVPARFIALAAALDKLGKRKDAIAALENAYELDRSTATLRKILALHEAAGDEEAIAATAARIEEQVAAETPKPKPIRAPGHARTRTKPRATTRTTRTARATRAAKTAKPVTAKTRTPVTTKSRAVSARKPTARNPKRKMIR